MEGVGRKERGNGGGRGQEDRVIEEEEVGRL